MVFVATTASIVSGALAERILIWPFFLFVALLAGFIYPIAGSLAMGWRLVANAFDFAGSTVHSVEVGLLLLAILLGAREGKFSVMEQLIPFQVALYQ